MIDFAEIEKQLNEDEAARKSLEEDPVGFFKDKGILLSDRMKESIVKFFSESKASGKLVPGSSLVKQNRLKIVVVTDQR
jgi:hypothetical protein